MTVVYELRSPLATADTSLPPGVLDPLVRGAANDGVRFIADLAFGYCYPGGNPIGRPAPGSPAQGAVVYDAAEKANASFVLASGQTVSYSGGGFDFSALTDRGSYLAIPASVAADLYAAFAGVSQRYVACLYVRLPSLADWNTDSNMAPFLHWSASAFNTPSTDLFTLGQTSGASKGIQLFRQTAGATAAALNVTPASADYGLLGQIGTWKTETQMGLRLRTVNGIQILTSATVTQNSGDFSALTGKLGVGTAFWRSPIGVQANSVKWRLHRAWIENLARSGRDPIAVLDADWARVQARITASAAANGGTSQIFV